MDTVYFASDFHLGSPGRLDTQQREKLIVQWLDEIKPDMKMLFLVGDVFDFWFDYKKVVPRGFIRILGKLAELKDRGVEIHYFTGNHDLWMFDYLKKELDIPIHHEAIEIELQQKKLLIGHGDGLGPGDKGYKRLKKLFASPVAQTMFRWIHPDLGIGLADYFSSKSRDAQDAVQHFLGAEKEWLIQYCEKRLQENNFDYFVFGHRHLPIDYTLSNGKSRYINLGDWLQFQSYAVLKDGHLQMKFYKNDNGKTYP